jgi:two-component system, repressor protein LuxO
MIGRIVIIEDSPSLARTYEIQLKREAAAIEIAESGQAGLQAISAGNTDCVLLDLGLPDMDGQEVLKSIRTDGSTTPVVVITADGSLNTAIEAMREGATDFLVKPFGAERLVTTVRNAVETASLRKIVRKIEASKPKEGFGDFIGSSPVMQAAYNTLEMAAPSKAPVLITGETGTGKELAARAIHYNSPRAGRAFVAVNCGAIPRDLIESELFGHVKGAFTGATADRAGAAELANGGTLFLDEIGEMPIDLQPKLLRFLQTGSYARVGDSRQRQADIRILAATNREPWKAVQHGLIREDLYFRLNVIGVELPGLRERGADIVDLAEHFLGRFCREEGRKPIALSDDARNALIKHSWPGNVRELENLMRRLAVLSTSREVTARDLSFQTQAFVVASAPKLPEAAQGASHAMAQPVSAHIDVQIEPLWQTERRAIEHAIAVNRNNVSEAARQLGVAPSTIYRKREQWAEQESGSGSQV